MSKPRCKVIFWDVGGTLLDFRCSPVESVRERFMQSGIDHGFLTDAAIAEFIEEFGRDERSRRTLEDERLACRCWAERLFERHQTSDQMILRVTEQLMNYASLFQPVEGITDLLSEIQRRGIRQIVVSNWPPSLPKVLGHHRLDRFFHAIIYSAEDGVHKPEEPIYRRALQAAEAESCNSIFIGDTPDCDVEPPRRLGMRAIHFDPRTRHATRDAENTTELRQILMKMLDS